MAYYTVKLMRGSFDILSGFNRGERNERKWVLRICFLETVAGVPGMVAAMLRHLSSLRRMQRDYGWIHTL
ncbi:alternative oxidase, partial [Mytilus galloprovincialis]